MTSRLPADDPATPEELASLAALGRHYKTSGLAHYVPGLRLYYAARKAGHAEGGGYTRDLALRALRAHRIPPHDRDLVTLPEDEPCPRCGLSPVHPISRGAGHAPMQSCTACGTDWFVV